ncbi:MAG: TolC family protein [Bdellovibrionales bacterium]
MRKSHMLFVGIFFFSSLQSVAQSVDVTYENLRSLLEERNIRLQASRLEQEAAEERQGSLGRSFLPSLELHGAQEYFQNGNEERKNQPTYGVELKINLFNGGQDQLESEIRGVSASKKTYQYLYEASQELQELRKLYWQILYSKEQLELLEAMIKINTLNLQAALRRIRSGVATESDRVEFEMKAVDLKRERDEESLRLTTKIRGLSVLLNYDLKMELKFPAKISHEHDFASMLQHSPRDHEFLYKDDELQGQVSELAAQKQGRVWWPKLDVYAAYNQYNEREKESLPWAERKESVLGLKMTMSLSAGFESRREAASLSKQALALRKRAHFKKAETEVHMSSELDELKLLHDQVHDAEENIVRAERYYRLTQSEYARGVKNSPDVLGSAEKLYEAKKKRLEITRDFQVAKAHVLAKIGK